MRKLITILILFLLWSCSKSTIAIQTRGTNILYENVDNYIEVQTGRAKKIIATVNNGTIETRSSNVYNIVVKNSMPTILTIKQGDLERKFEFRTKQIPMPQLYFLFEGETSHNNKYTALKFQKLKSIIVSINDFQYKCQYEIGKFDLLKIKKNGYQKVYNLTNLNFATSILKESDPGDIYIFSNIEINFINDFNKTIKIDDFSVIIE